MKILSLQMIPWCLLGNQMSSCMQLHDDDDDEQEQQQQQQHKKKKKKKQKKKKSGSGIIKVIKWDGVVKIYERGVEAWELMEEYPKHMLCRSDSFYIGQRIPPLSPHDLLLLGHNYFLLPNHLFQSVLSFVNLASSFASSSSSNPNSSSNNNNNNYSAFLNNDKDKDKDASAASCQPPFHIQKSPSGSLSIRVSEDFISQLMLMQHQQHHDDEQEEEVKNRLVLCTTPQLQKEYRQLVVVGRRQWKPKLEIIRETSPRDKRKLSSFGGKN